MTGAERKRRWRDLHRECLPWPEDRLLPEDFVEWQREAERIDADEAG